jgi:beta-lactamase superfamily II metal-dependent hydrolase
LFQKDAITTFSMLIDCGGIKTSSALVSPCVEDIKKTCNGTLDLLVVTHQHEDHISGFNLARQVFDKIQVNEVWMSWLENNTDPIAAILKKKYGKKLKELKEATIQADQAFRIHVQRGKAMKRVHANLQAKHKVIENTLGLIEFEEGLSHGKGLAAGARTNEDAMNYVKSKGKKISYRLPGEVLKNIQGAEGIKFYILGPPRDKDLKFLKIEMDEEEMYKIAVSGATNDSVMQSRIFKSGVTLCDKVSPFGDEYLASEAEKKTFLTEYNSSEFKWRQIETDWLDVNNGLALALTKLTNNTSLAMALEFEDSGKVILLPADAQSGNWLSWHTPDLMKKLKVKGGKNTDELLGNTIFYKVGHHGSHNGTASKSGLDRISGENLVAFMPLVQDKVPIAWGGSQNFPAKKLNQVLIEKTKGRLIRTDVGLVTDNNANVLRNSLNEEEKSNWKKNFRKGQFYFEYTVNMNG